MNLPAQFNHEKHACPKQSRRGITLLELLLVLGVISVLAVSTTPYLSSTLQRYQAATGQDRLLSALRKAQSFSAERRLGEEWGVCITSGKLRLFAGNCTVPVYSEDWTLPSPLSITGFTSLTFSAYRGEPSSTPTIIITTQIKSSTVTINRIGGIDVN